MPADHTPMVLGVDVGGTKVAVAALEGGRIGAQLEHPTDLSSSESLLDGIEAAFEEIVEVAGRPAAVGAGIPSQIDFASGRVLSSVNIPLEGVPLREELAGRLGVPVVVDNDANCAALAEAHELPGSNIVMLTLGTGVGGGVVVGDRIFRGSSGLGAELGHLVIDENGPPCPGSCPNRGCLEAFCSGTALERDAAQLAEDRPDTALGQVLLERGKVRGRDVVGAAEEGDPHALDLFDRLGRQLGVGIASLVNIFEPEHVVVGGGLGSAAGHFLERARREAAIRALPALWERAGVSRAAKGVDAGVIGAGLLALQEFDPTRDTPAPTRGEAR
ncbi:MAG: ROK family protein [Thermoleophilaceae bacterium]|nr:ROK family protein [Thermoleophilaceae bacterium]